LELFGTAHLLTLLVGTVFGILCIVFRRRGCVWPVALLALLNLSAYGFNQWVYENGEEEVIFLHQRRRRKTASLIPLT
jgi:hypothetical protein